MTLKRGLVIGVVVAAAAGLAAVATTRMNRPSAPARGVPTARVVAGPMRLDVRTVGEMRAGRVVTLAAPAAGSSLRVVRIAETGAAVHKDDVIIEFDPADQLYSVEQSQSELAESEQQIVRLRADLDAQIAADQVGLLTARFDVRRAELDAKMPERLISGIDFKKRALALEENRRRLAQLDHDALSRTITGRAGVAVVEERRNRSRLSAERSQQIIDSLDVLAPIDGLVVVRENRDAMGGMFFAGLSLPEFRAGDTVASGRPVIDVFATGEMEIRAKVSEQERSNIAVGQAATVRSDSLAGRAFSAHVSAIAGSASRPGENTGPLRQFDVSLKPDNGVSGLGAGTTVRIVITGSEIGHVLTIPRQAVFQKNGNTVVYLRVGDRFDAREVKTTYRSESRIAIEGVAEGAEVALVNPEVAAAVTGEAKPAPTPTGGPK